MKKYLILLASIVLAACASNPSNDPSNVVKLGAKGYTEAIIGNTASYSNGASYYYQVGDDTKTSGTRFAKEKSGKVVETQWSLDESGNMCEITTRGTEFCIAQAPNLSLTQVEGSNSYSYKDDDFSAKFSVSEGDSLGFAN